MDHAIARTIINEFVDTTQEYFTNHSYSAGYMTSVILELLAEVPPHKVMEVLSHMERNTKEYAEKIKEAA